MQKILDYFILEQITENRSSIIYRAHRENSDDSVIIKALKTKNPTPSEIARFRHEYKLIKGLNIQGIIKVLDLLEHKDGIALVLEDFDSVSIKSLLDNENKFDLKSFFNIAIKIADALGILHENEIIHRDIKPHNILINTDTGDVKITDFGISSELTHQNDEIYNPEVLYGNLAYMSPEQTGRMNRSVDYRTDIYSLGITLYEMLTCSLPFVSDDPMAMIHYHIAVMPVPPKQNNPEIPEVISEIIMKLLSKNNEDRYQNCFGLVADLKECLEQFTKNGKIEYFEPGRQDISNRFIIPQKLFGREKEIDTLVSGFKELLELQNSFNSEEEQSGVGIMLVAGNPGIGKSALINEIHKPIVERRGYFISGKYEQFGRDKPYSAIIQAFQGLVKHILAESNQSINTWKEKLLEALGPNGKVITEIIPEIELIIGEQPEPAELGPEETRNRFKYVFERFASVFPTVEHPVVLFLDDLQWADIPGMQLIKDMTTSQDINYLYVIGSYRDNEVEETHPLTDAINEIEKAGIKINRINLGPILEDDIKNLIVNFLNCEDKYGALLAGLVHEKTGGNPFFVIQFLETLHNEKLIEFDPTQGWIWDIEKINQLQVTDNVVELLAGKIHRLPDNTQEVLKICAAIGSRFDLETLSFILGYSIDKALSNLTEVISEGIISLSSEKGLYLFHHDRIQEAAYSLILDDEKPALHYRIGRKALEKASAEDDLENKLFYIVDQLNIGSGLITNRKEREELAIFNLDAGIKAKASSAFAPAFLYFETAIKSLENKYWEKQYDLALSLYTEIIETAYLNGDYDKMDELAEAALQYTRTNLDKVKIISPRIGAARSQEDFQGSVDAALPILKLLGIRLPKKPNRLHVATQLLRVKFSFRGKKPEDLLNLQVATDPKIIASMKIYASIGLSAFFVNQNLFALIVLKAVRLAFKYGLTPDHAFTFVAYGIILVVGFQDFDGGIEFSEYGFKLIEKLGARKQLSKSIFAYNGLIHYWKFPLYKTIAPLQEGYRIGLETGDLDYTAWNLFMSDLHSIYVGNKLPELEIKIVKNIKIIAGFKQKYILTQYLLVRQFILNMLGQCDNPAMLTGKAVEGEKLLPSWIRDNNRAALATFYFARSFLRVFFCEYSLALEDSDILRKYMDSMQGSVVERYTPAFDSTARLMLYPEASLLKKIKHRLMVRSNLKKIKRWADHNPEDFQHIYYAINALRIWRIRKDTDRAKKEFEQAIALCKRPVDCWIESYAHEILAMLYISLGDKKMSKECITATYNSYSYWDVTGKMKQLREKYPEFLEIPKEVKSSDITSTTTESGTISQALDISTVIKASQAISSEIDLGKLLMNIMKLSMENAGADKGIMLLEENGQLMIEAERVQGIDKAVVLQSIPVDSHEGLSSNIVNYVARTKETLILNDTAREGIFTEDPYIIKKRPKSILCLPVINQGKLLGILYLENNLTTGAFTPQRLEILNIISSQIAISIDNAKLYENLEEKVKERTNDLEKANIKLIDNSLELSTANEKLEEANQKLEELDKLKTNFFTNISHELRTPLTLILSLVEAIQLGVYGSILNNDDDLFKSMHKNSARLLKLINNLLDFSKIEAGRMEVRSQKSNISKLLRFYSSSVVSSAKSKGIDIEFIDNTDGLIAWIDQDLTEKAVYNLISNAMKFTPHGGRITITLTKQEDLFSISVIDTGIGISGDQINKIFERFSQVDSSITRNYDGTGIGLSLTKEIVELQGGTISVESEMTKGSEFVITLPIDSQADMKDPVQQEISPEEETRMDNKMYTDEIVESNPYMWGESPDGEDLELSGTNMQKDKSKTILIVDDNPDMIKFLNSLLEKEYNIINASNGREALSKLYTLKRKPDLVLSDIMMPEMDGYELTVTIRSDKKFEGLPIILLTAKAEASMKIKSIEKGAADYIVKPFNPRELTVRIKSMLDLKEVRDQLLIANDQLKQAINDSGILVSDIGHKFYNELWPFAQMIMIGKKILSQLEDNNTIIDSESFDFAQRTLSKCEQSLRTIEEMKNTIKQNFGKVAERVNNKIKYILDEILVKVEDDIINSDITIAKNFDFDADKEVKINSEQIQSAIENIINNSIHALNLSGKKDKKIFFNAHSENDNFIISIEDNGTGVSEEVREKIFGMFFSLKSKKDKDGLGLGLHITRWIIEDCHKGKIELESEIGEYTRFIVSLPEKGEI